jgi:hypothetical protein
VDKAQPLSKGMLAMGVFLFFGATMALLAGVTLAWPGTILDGIWRLNPSAYRQLAPLGRVVGIGFLFLSTVMAIAGTGWFKRKIWGWWVAVGILATQCLGDLANVVMGHVAQGLIGVSVAGGLLFYLLRRPTRNCF